MPVCLSLLVWFAAQNPAIEVPYKGLRYHMLSRGGITVMIAPLERTILEYATAQVWISNGSKVPVKIAPQAFAMRLQGAPAGTPGAPDGFILQEIQKRVRGRDMQELVRAYETALFGFGNQQSLGYYQQRKQAALSQFGGKLRAVATASAIILPERVLKPGEALDGTVFFRNDQKQSRIAAFSARIAGQVYEFPLAPEPEAAHARQ
jgi:hypothetical protein